MKHCVVLIVDDDPAIVSLLAEAVVQEGYVPETARTGEEALARIAGRRPDLILLDLQLPGLTGWDVATELQKQRIDIPIVVISAAPRAGAWAKHMRAVDFLAKPFDLEDALATIHRACSALSLT